MGLSNSFYFHLICLFFFHYLYCCILFNKNCFFFLLFLEGGLLKWLELLGHFTPMRPTSFRLIFLRIIQWKLHRLFSFFFFSLIYMNLPFIASFGVHWCNSVLTVNGFTGDILASGSIASSYLQQWPYLFRYVCWFHALPRPYYQVHRITDIAGV
jgi:hypothetical protein